LRCDLLQALSTLPVLRNQQRWWRVSENTPTETAPNTYRTIAEGASMEPPWSAAHFAGQVCTSSEVVPMDFPGSNAAASDPDKFRELTILFNQKSSQ